MRELKYHEKKLLKKVDFLNVSVLRPKSFPFFLTICCFSSGSRRATFGRSKSCDDITSKTGMTTRNTTSYAVRFGRMHTGCLSCPPKIPSDPRWKASCSPSCTTCESHGIPHAWSYSPSRGVLNTTAKLSDIENKLTVAAFCRRRLGVVVCRLKMAETVSAVSPFCHPYRFLPPDSHPPSRPTDQAVAFVEQGHIRVGPDVITDPAYLVPRYLSLSDYG